MGWWDDKFTMHIIRHYWLFVRESVSRWLFTSQGASDSIFWWFIWYNHELTFEQTIDMPVIKLIGAWKFWKKYQTSNFQINFSDWSISYKIAFMKLPSD